MHVGEVLGGHDPLELVHGLVGIFNVDADPSQGKKTFSVAPQAAEERHTARLSAAINLG